MNVSEETSAKKPEGLGARHLQCVLLFLGMLLGYMMRVNMSMAIVDMTDQDKPQFFNWSLQTQTVILSSFFWGYVLLQVPGGELASRFGAKWLFTVAVSVNSLVSVLIPTAAEMGGWETVCACRVVQGLTQAALFPAAHHLISRWVPLDEKGILCAIVYAGAQLGVALQLIISGFIAAAWGWQGIFYTNGALGAVWTIVYLIFGSSLPEDSKIITRAELRYIQKSLGSVTEKKRLPTPWRKVLTSLPSWAILAAHCGQNWGFYTLMTEIPTYMSKVLHIELKNNGVLSALPYLGLFVLSFPMGAMTDLIIKRNWLSVTHSRKLFNSIGLWGPALALLGLSYVPAGDRTLAVALLTLTVALNAGHLSGFMLVHIDVAPNFSAALMGFTNCVANVVSIVAPLVCGLIIQDEKDPEEWRKVFFLASGIYFVLNLFFVIFGTSERQDWNEPKEAHDAGRSSFNRIISDRGKSLTLVGPTPVKADGKPEPDQLSSARPVNPGVFRPTSVNRHGNKLVEKPSIYLQLLETYG